jgi:hypothetical protein
MKLRTTSSPAASKRNAPQFRPLRLAFALAAAILLAAARSAAGQGPTPPQTPNAELVITVADENGLVVSSARLILTEQKTQAAIKGETDYAGRHRFTGLPPGLYSLRVEKEGFYVVMVREVHVGETESLEVTLNHTQEYVESVNVVYSPPAIDPAKTSASATLDTREVINLPYTVTRDIRYALPLLPGVLQDAYGQVHVDGSATRQVFDQLDGFNVSDPASGLFNLRVSVDALRSVEVQSSRYPVEYGKGSGGIVSLRTGMGDDRYRLSATDFIPTVQGRKGLHINTWTPRATFSGPLRKGRAWFLEALDGEYNLDVVKELPAGADQNPSWRVSNLSKAQVNLTSSNILTTSFLVNGYRSDHAGLSPFDPLETTVNRRESAYLFTAKDQVLLPMGLLLEVGLGVSRFHSGFRPQGQQTYVITPDGTSGNFFETADGHTGRLQGIVNIFLPPLYWSGRHELKLGVDVDRLTDRQSFERRPVTVLRQDGTLSRQISFSGGPGFTRNNFEVSGYAQDRWHLSDRWLVEPGLRFDWDEIVRDFLLSPRLASTFLLSPRSETKLAAGVGVYNDPANLDILTRPLTGQRTDLFYDPTGQELVRPPAESEFRIDERELKVPRFLNWSVGLEQKMPGSIYLRAQFVQKRGRDGWTFINEGAAQSGDFSGRFVLTSERRDRYDAFEVSLRRTFRGNHVLFASYTRSAARSNAVLNFSLDNLVFSQQAGGPLAWDAPNRVLSWGWLPLPRRFTLAYSLDWRDGFPFTLVNQDQQLVGLPGSQRFPAYFSLNLQLERRFRLFGFLWALRGGFDNITNRQNPFAVNNNVDSPHFLTFSAIQGRAFTGRIRFLGRK